MRGQDAPELNLIGHDAKVYATLRFEGDLRRLILGMSEEKLEGRVMLGFMQPDTPSPNWDDWGLLFRTRLGTP